MTNINITNEQKVHIKLAPKTAAGGPANIDGKATFEVIEGDANVTADDDGLGAYLISGSNAGVSKIKVTADADLGEGVVPISEDISLNVIFPMATSLGMEVADAEPK